MNNFDLILKGENEFTPNKNNKIYFILKVDSQMKENMMSDIILNFIKNQTKNIKEKHYIGIDLEFNKVSKETKDVALIQLNLENNNNKAHILIFDPSTIKNKDLLVNLLSNKNMIKILHGAESLDIPYLFNQLLITKENIKGFCNNFYDTKYLCEYYHIENNIKSSCSIYHLLFEHNIINENKISELEEIENIMGPIYLIDIDVYKLSFEMLKYALYDVIYLPELIKVFMSKTNIYTHIIQEITCLIYKYKKKK